MIEANKKQAKTLSIVGLVLAVLFSPVGLVVSIIALSKSRSEKSGITLPLIGIILASIISLVGYIPMLIVVSDHGMDKAFRELLIAE